MAETTPLVVIFVSRASRSESDNLGRTRTSKSVCRAFWSYCRLGAYRVGKKIPKFIHNNSRIISQISISTFDDRNICNQAIVSDQQCQQFTVFITFLAPSARSGNPTTLTFLLCLSSASSALFCSIYTISCSSDS